MTRQEIDIVNDLLDYDVSNQGRRSCLSLALKSARKHTGRDIYTGKDIDGLINDNIFDSDSYHSEYFTGLALYLIILDQVGCIFKKNGYDEGNKTNGIQIALENFSKFSDDKIKAIRALRNSLAHNFGLASAKNAKSKKKKQLYKFSLHFDKSQQPIIPNLTWNNEYNDKSDNTDTIVGVEQLCNLVENVYSDLLSEFKNGNVELRIKNLDEIKARFTII